MSGILDFFVPQEKKFFRILHTISIHARQGSAQLLVFLQEYERTDDSVHRKRVGELKQLELLCDEQVKTLILDLNQTFLTPIDREDLHRLSSLLDDVMDSVYSTANKFILFNVTRIPPYLLELAKTVASCAEEVEHLIAQLDHPSSEHMALHFSRLHELEEKADSLRDQAMMYLFSNEIPATDIIKFSDLYSRLEIITDKSKDISDCVEGILIKYS
ncbi:MAG: DUF47 family protein [Candidatus Diapherotrites archaeon]|nr:DUF47 family protein [Candidatus Diapherotrites archaeon]